MASFVLWSMIALQSVLLAMEPCASTRRGRDRRGQRQDALRVRFGVDDVDNKYPYVVSLRYKGQRTCTGTLISPDWVLTAAHCGELTNLRFGNMTTKRNKQFYRKVIKMITHSSHMILDDIVHIANDIALVQVEPVHLKNYGNVSAVNYRSLIGYQVEYAGFGATSTNSDEGHYNIKVQDKRRPLQLGEGVIISCRYNYYVTAILCVAPKCSNKMHDTLPGDSGGPLFYANKIVAVLTGGDEPPVSFYAPVSPYLDWIHDIVSHK